MGYLIYTIILNILLIGAHIPAKWTDFSTSNEISWTRKAAKEAEVTGSNPCSGHGRAFLDSLEINGKHVCECYACYSGFDCSSISYPCLANADSGDPIFLEPYWRKQREESSVLIAGWHRLSYAYQIGDQMMSNELEKYIIKLHDLIGNAVTKGRYIVFGTGSTQLISAAVHALSLSSRGSPAFVLANPPYYGLYKSQTDYFQTRNYEFKGDVSQYKNKTDNSQMYIEFVTSPNNPDGQLMEKVLNTSLSKPIHDHAYYWPHFTSIPSPADEDIMLFTVSKLTGHAGSRFGWALVKDEEVYRKMKAHVSYSIFSVSHDTQLRVFELLKVVVDGGGRDLFDFGYGVMKDRWQRLNAVFSESPRFSLQKIAPKFCSYYQQVKQPSPAYAWVKCERKEDENCYEVLKSAGIVGRQGQVFGAEDRFVRLSLLKSNDDFELLLEKLWLLVTTNYSSKIENH